MALVTDELGAGLIDAESYASVAALDAYAKARKRFGGSGNVPNQEAALRNATGWIDATYGGRWKGTRLTAGQALAWPRMGAIDPDGFSFAGTIPRALQHATIEVAMYLLEGNTLDVQPNAAPRIKRLKEQVGPIATETEYAIPVSASAPRLSRVDGLLAPLLRDTGSAFFLRA